MQALLIGESFSPWTKKARWALEHCGLTYDYQEYTPTLSEPALRWRLRQWSDTVTVPILFIDEQVIRGSWDIARYANETSSDRRLGQLDQIVSWNELSEAALAEGRTRVVRCILSSEQALEEALPEFVPKALRRPLRFMARDAVKRLDRKYAHLAQPGALHHALTATREGLALSQTDFLLDHFSYADIAMATVLEVIAPIARHEPPLERATARCWNDTRLAQEFADLVAWRTRLVASDVTTFSQFQQTVI